MPKAKPKANSRRIPRAAAWALLAATAAAPADETATAEQASAPTAHGEGASAGRFSRREWGLDESEWQRYQSLLGGIRGSVSPATLSPPEVLGIHARDDAERDKYARQFAQMMRDDAARVLAFQRAYDRASLALNPSGLAADPAGLPRQSPKPGRNARAQLGDRLLLFVPAGECAGCAERLSAALRGQREGAQLDIYVVGGGDDDGIRAWAKAHRIDAEAVRQKRVTLNHERGELARLATAAPPALFLIRNGQTILLARGQP